MESAIICSLISIFGAIVGIWYTHHLNKKDKDIFLKRKTIRKFKKGGLVDEIIEEYEKK